MEKINILTHKCDESDELHDMEIAFPLDEPDSYNFEEIVIESNLTERYSPEQLQELETLLGKFRGGGIF